MFFTRTQTFSSPVSKKELQSRLLGKHVRIHNLDFEILDRDNTLMIIPFSEQEEGIKTLPITNVDLSENGGKTNVSVKCQMRPADSGGPQLILIFCFFLFIAAFVLHIVDANSGWTVSYILLGADVLIFSMFLYRLQTGYFDYVRKVQAFVKGKAETATAPDVKVTVAI